MWKLCTVLFLLASPPAMDSNETPTPTTLHTSSPTSSTASLGQVKLTNRIVGKRKVSSRKRKKVEFRRTEGDPRNTQASFRLQDFKMWKFSMFLEWFAFYVLFLLALPPIVNSKEILIPRMCAVCLEKDCATGVRRIYPAGSDTAVWVYANPQTAIQTCSMENLKADAPCKMANGSLVQLANIPLYFEGIDTYDVRGAFGSQISPCDKLNLPPSSTPSPASKASIHNTPTPAAPNNSVAYNKGIIIGIDIVFGIGSILIPVLIGVLLWKRKKCGQGQDGDHRHGNNGVPHDAEDRDEITIKKQPFKGEVPNGNINWEDYHIGAAGLLERWDNNSV